MTDLGGDAEYEHPKYAGKRAHHEMVLTHLLEFYKEEAERLTAGEKSLCGGRRSENIDKPV